MVLIQKIDKSLFLVHFNFKMKIWLKLESEILLEKYENVKSDPTKNYPI